jgi:hypothetical protein
MPGQARSFGAVMMGLKMTRSLATVAFSLGAACAWGASSPATDAQWEGYFDVWAKDGTATLQAVEEFYASRVNYYGHEMTPAEVYQDKSHLIRLWPIRNYHVAPGTVVTKCSEDNNRCAVTLVMDWMSANPALRIGTQGATTVSLLLTRQGGQMKIERESGIPLMQSSCKLEAADWRERSNWQCSAYHFIPLPDSSS